MTRQESMKSANLDLVFDDLEVARGSLVIPKNRSDYSVRMIAKLIEIQNPKDAVSIRTIQRAIAAIKDLGLEHLLSPTYKQNTPYYGRFACELILTHLKFTVQE